jgi:Fe-S cluster assembly protein SufD
MNAEAPHTAADPVFGAFDEALLGRALAAESRPRIRDARRLGFETFRALPAPSPTEEEWRRTPPARFPFSQWPRLPEAGVAQTERDPAIYDAFDAVLSVSESGVRLIRANGVDAAKAIRIWTSADDSVWPEELDGYFVGAAEPHAEDKFSALTRCLWNFAFGIVVPDGVQLPRGVLVHYRHRLNVPALFLPLGFVRVGRKASFALTEWHDMSSTAPMGVCGSLFIEGGDACRVHALRLQTARGPVHWLTGGGGRVGGDSRLEWTSLTLGARVTKTNLCLETAGRGAEAHANGLYFAGGEQHMDHRTLQVHSATDTLSKLLYKGVLQDEAHTVYQGLIQAAPHCVRVDAYQKNNNVLLGEGARAESLPGLLIEADDLRCTHGSTIGSLDPEQMFYLRSRGLDEAEARRVLIDGFLGDILREIPYDALRKKMQRIVDGKIRPA